MGREENQTNPKRCLTGGAKNPQRKSNTLVSEKENFDLEKYKSLYSDVMGVVGVYLQTNISKT